MNTQEEHSSFKLHPFMTTKALVLWLILTIFMLVYTIWSPIHPDEAYYFTWSQHLALSYYDGPPLTAWLLRVFTAIFGIHVWSIKLISVLAVSLSALALYRLAALLFDFDVAFKTLCIFLLIPITQATNFITTLDPLLMLFWSLSLYSFWLWINKPNLLMSILTGCMIGLGFLAKYPMILFIPSAFITLLLTPYRTYLLKLNSYMVIFVALLFSLPVIIWNANHHWISLGFQWHHGTSHHIFQMQFLDSYLLAQLGAFNPIYFCALIILSCKYFKDFRHLELLFLAIPTLFVLCIFGYFGLYNRTEANWTMPAYLSASILLAYFFDKHRFSLSFWAGILLNILVILLLKFPYFAPNNVTKMNPIVQYYGYSQVIDSLAMNLTPQQLALPILTDRYQSAAEIQLQLPKHPHVCIVTPTRKSEVTISCRKFKLELEHQPKKVLWFLPQTSLNLVKHMNHCKVLAVADYNYFPIKRKWSAIECDSILSKSGS